MTDQDIVTLGLTLSFIVVVMQSRLTGHGDPAFD